MNRFDEAAAALEAAKIEEAAATAKRIDAELAVLCMLQGKEEGSVTERGLRYKVTATFGYSRTIDAAALEAVRQAVPVALFEQAIDYKPALKLPGLRYLQMNEPGVYSVLAQAITAKPSKPSVKVERLVEAKEAA